MRSRPLKSLCRTLGIALIVLGGQAALADTVGFPPDNPDFTFELPDGWTATHNPESGSMSVIAQADEPFVITFLSTQPISSPEMMKKGMELTVNGAVEGVQLAEVVRGEIETTEVETGRWFVAQRVDAKFRDQPMVLIFQIFNTSAGRGYGMYSMGSPEADEARIADYEALLESITMLE